MFNYMQEARSPQDVAGEHPEGLREFESIALELYPAKRQAIAKAIGDLKKALAEVYKKIPQKPSCDDRAVRPLFENSQGDPVQNQAWSKIYQLELELKAFLKPLKALRSALDKKKPLNQTLIQQIKAFLWNVFRITGEASLDLEIKKIDRALNSRDPKPKNIFEYLIDGLIVAIDAVYKCIANHMLDIKASVYGVGVTEPGVDLLYEDTWVPNRFRRR